MAFMEATWLSVQCQWKLLLVMVVLAGFKPNQLVNQSINQSINQNTFVLQPYVTNESEALFNKNVGHWRKFF